MCFGVESANGAQAVALRVDEGHPSIKAEVRFTGHHGKLGKAIVTREVRNEEDVIAGNGSGKGRCPAGQLGQIGSYAILGLQPFAEFIDQGDNGVGIQKFGLPMR